MEPENVLANISRARQILAEARDITDVLDIRDAAVAAHAYAKAKNADEAAQMAMELKLRSERRAGEFLQDIDLKPGRPKNTDKMSALSKLNISQQESSRWQRIAKIPVERFEEYLAKALERTQSALLNLVKGAHVGQSTGEFEWYTPKEIIEAARRLMKTIDVDPASSDIANQIVKATIYYTVEDDGLKQEWKGNVWMNPPYSQPLVTQFCNLLVEKYVMGEINQACVLVNNATETEFYQNMMKHCKAICFIKGRVKFTYKGERSTGAPLQGQTILYFGDNMTDFRFIFSEFGVVLHAEQ